MQFRLFSSSPIFPDTETHKSRALIMEGNVEDLLRVAGSMFSNNDLQIDHHGRTIHISTKGRFHNLKEPWVYDATAWDIESGTSVRVKHFKESMEAAKAAVHKLISKLQEEGVIAKTTSCDQQPVIPEHPSLRPSTPATIISSPTPIVSQTVASLSALPVTLLNDPISSIAPSLTPPTTVSVSTNVSISSSTLATSSEIPSTLTNLTSSSTSPFTTEASASVELLSTPNIVPSCAAPSTSPNVSPVALTSPKAVSASTIESISSSTSVPRLPSGAASTSPNLAPMIQSAASPNVTLSPNDAPAPLTTPSIAPSTSSAVASRIPVTSPNVASLTEVVNSQTKPEIEDGRKGDRYFLILILGLCAVGLLAAGFQFVQFVSGPNSMAEVNMKTSQDKLNEDKKNGVFILQSANGVNDDLMKIANAFVNDKGQIQYKGRTIHFSTKGRVHSFSEPWVYDATAWDVESGTSAKARHFDESEDAAQAAFKKLIDELKQKGILKEQEEETPTSGKGNNISPPENKPQPNQQQPNQPPPVTNEGHKEAQKDTSSAVGWGVLQYLSGETFADYFNFALGILFTACLGLTIKVIIHWRESNGWEPRNRHSSKRYRVDDRTTSYSGHRHDDWDDYMEVEPDFNGLYTSIHVQAAKPTPQQLDSTQNYCMWSPVKGLAYILNNSHFPEREKNNQDRHGSHEDFVNMKHLFTELGYKIVPHENLDAQNIRETIRDFVLMFNETESCEYMSAVVVLMSHGDTGYIQGTDDRPVQLKDIQLEFEGKRCPKLQGKPKLFFIQACRGKLVTSSTVADITSDNANPSSQETEISEVDVAADDNFAKDVPDNADMHFAYATTEGYLSLRSKRNGSWFIQVIAEVFLAHAHKENLDKLMNMVTNRVTGLKGKLYDPQANKKVIAQQTPERVTRMRKTLYFLPNYPPTY